MTSPSQLKYLDAIGIPVWVSRNLLIEESVDVEDGQATLATNNVDNILHDLEVQTEKSENSTKPIPTRKHLNTPTSTAKSAPVTTQVPQSNEVGRSSLHTVYACGSLQADWLIVGEAPELISDRKNQPFAGDSGTLLINMLRAVGIEKPRQGAYLINILKSSVRSTPELEQESNNEIMRVLKSKVDQVKPKMILVVGQIAAQRLLNSKEPLARLRGKQYYLPNTKIPLIVTYYPSYLLSKPLDKRKAWEDLKLAMRTLS